MAKTVLKHGNTSVLFYVFVLITC